MGQEKESERCAECLYYLYRTCRRFPPAQKPEFVSGWGTLSPWPCVKGSDWCGEFKTNKLSKSVLT